MSSGFTKKPSALGYVLLILACAICTPSWAQTGPVGWWKLDEGTGTTTADASGNSNTGTLTNSPTWSTGRVGSGSLTFNGGTSSVAVSASTTLAKLYSTGLTVSAWIKPSGAGGGSGGRIVDKDNNDVGWFFAMSGTNALKLSSDQFLTSQPSRTSSATITLNAWQHVLATWDGSTTGANMHIYINGVLADGTSVNGSGAADDDTATPLTIGNRPVDNARGFSGLIDDVRVYNRILSSTEIQALADATAPSAPSGLTATAASSSQINLSWTASTDNVGVTGYLLERCQGASCTTFAQIATPTTTSYSDTGLAASTSYSYRVRATDANTNLSGYSSTASATTSASGGDTTPPTAPSGLTATGSSTSQINLSWTASTDNVGVTGYQVERCTGANCSAFGFLASPTQTTYSDTALTGSTRYSYRVRATDAAGNFSGYSNIASPPTAPSGVTATAISASQINLSWTASTDNVGVTGYKIERCQGASCSSFTQIATPTTTTYSDTGLTSSTPYSYRVRATNAAAHISLYSNTGSATTSAGAPIAYVQSKSTSQNNSSQSTITAVFSSAQTAGNFNVVAIGWGSTTVGVSSVVDSKGNTYTLAAGPTAVTSLGTVAIYYAKNIVAAAAGANTVTVTFPSGVPFPDLRIAEYSGISTTSPLDVTAVSNGTGTLSSSGSATTTNANDLLIGSNWVASGTTGAGTGYTSRQISGWDGDILEDQIVSATGTYSATAPLSPSAAWIMQMAAFKGAASGGDTTPPSAPTGLSASASSATQINLSWTASTDNVGVTGYVLERCPGATCVNFSQIATPTTTSYSDTTGLSAATTYRYQIKAKDAATNYSAYSNIATTSTDLAGTYAYSVSYVYDEAGRLKTTSYANGASTAYGLDAAGNRLTVTRTAGDVTPPNPPGVPTFSSVTGTSATASWAAATDNVGVDHYEYQYNTTGILGANWTATNGLVLSVALPQLVCSTHYTFWVRAVDAARNAGSPNSATFTTLDSCAPSAPGTLSFSSVSTTSATISWGAAVDNVAITGYEWSLDGGATWNGTTSLSVALTGLRPGHLYSPQVRAYDTAGNRGASTSGSFDTFPTAPGTPTFSSITRTSAVVSYTAATSDEAITYEYSFSSGGPWTSSGSALSFTLTGLTPETSYTVYVHAKATQTSGTSSASFATPTDSAVMSVTFWNYGSPVGYGYGFYAPLFGSMSPATLTGGKTYQNWQDLQGYGFFSVAGFTADPGASWLTSVSALGVTKTGASATYGYSSGVASWTWSNFQFGFASYVGQNVATAVVHK